MFGKSKYFETKIEGVVTVYTVSKYGIYAEKTEDLNYRENRKILYLCQTILKIKWKRKYNWNFISGD